MMVCTFGSYAVTFGYGMASGAIALGLLAILIAGRGKRKR